MARGLSVTVIAASLAVAAGCGGGETTTTVTTESTAHAERLNRFAYREVNEHAIKTCSLVPRRVLYAAFERGSSDRPGEIAKSASDDNGIALLYAEDVDISPIRLQQAAYDGCLTGLLSPVAALERCTKADGSGYGWSAEVSGISCDEVGQFIEREIFPRAGQVARRNTMEAGGFACDVTELTDEPGWRVSCDQADQHFVFNWTP